MVAKKSKGLLPAGSSEDVMSFPLEQEPYRNDHFLLIVNDEDSVA